MASGRILVAYTCMTYSNMIIEHDKSKPNDSHTHNGKYRCADQDVDNGGCDGDD